MESKMKKKYEKRGANVRTHRSLVVQGDDGPIVKGSEIKFHIDAKGNLEDEGSRHCIFAQYKQRISRH